MGSRLLLLLAVTIATPALASGTDAFSFAPIGAASVNSPTFALVEGSACNMSVVDTIYGIYSQNRNLFDACVADSDYQIFPYAGTSPTRDQIGAMAGSTACAAMTTAIVISGVTECSLSSLPILAAAESLIKVAVDISTFPTQLAHTLPSSERYFQLMYWRRDSNLARAAGLPCDSASQLFAEYEANLLQATTNNTASLSPNLTIEYRLANGTVLRGSSLTLSNATSATSKAPNSTNTDASTSGMSANQVQGYVTAEYASEEEVSTSVSVAPPRSWDWRMAFAIVLLASLRLALPLV